MGDMIKAVKKNFDLKSGLSSRFLDKTVLFLKPCWKMENSKIISPSYLRIVELLDSG